MTFSYLTRPNRRIFNLGPNSQVCVLRVCVCVYACKHVCEQINYVVKLVVTHLIGQLRSLKFRHSSIYSITVTVTVTQLLFVRQL